MCIKPRVLQSAHQVAAPSGSCSWYLIGWHANYVACRSFTSDGILPRQSKHGLSEDINSGTALQIEMMKLNEGGARKPYVAPAMIAELLTNFGFCACS